MTQYKDIPTDKIVVHDYLVREIPPPKMDELCLSIKKCGIIEPLVVAEYNGEYHLVSGHCRLEAAKRLGLPSVPSTIISADQEQALALNIHENMYRTNPSAWDEARLFAHIRDQLKYPNKKIAQLIGKSEAYISQRLSMLDWDREIIEAVHTEKISFSVGREIVRVQDRKHRKMLLHHAIREGVNYRTAQYWVQQYLVPDRPTTGPAESPPPAPTDQTETIVTARCFGCHQIVPIHQVTRIELCQACYEDLTR